jgi:penicillin-binding protein 1C
MRQLIPSRKCVLRCCAAGGVVMTIVGIAFTTLWHVYPLPEDMLGSGPPGAITLALDGEVLLNITAPDDMKRLPIGIDDMSPWIPLALVAAEDARFNAHIGIDPIAIASSLADNIASGRVVRGASTITMQVAGMKLGHPRTWTGKAVEGFRALQIDAKYDKSQILESWLNMASFGGNVIGIEAASRAWFGKPALHCTLAESALLVGLPKSPERFRPDRHLQSAISRRDEVLSRMLLTKSITKKTFQQAVADQPVLNQTKRLRNDDHAGWLALRRDPSPVRHTTIDPELQNIASTIARRHLERLPHEIDVAVVLVNLNTSSVRALIGSANYDDPRDGQINGAIARRSPGSALKPFVYAAAFESGRLLPDSIVDDSPLDIDGWRPRNIDRSWRGPLTAAAALVESRNTPAIRIGRDLGVGHVAATMRRCGLRLPESTAHTAGLSLVVGGMEVTPWSLAEAYATLARGGEHMPIHLIDGAATPRRRALSRDTCRAIEYCLAGEPTDADCIMPFLAAKTGTSSGHRDALAAGWNRNWAAVVWIGRFDDRGDPVLLGADAAMPILQELMYHPALSTTRTDSEWTPWTVRRPVGRASPKHVAILDPRDGDILYAMDTTMTFTPRIRGSTESSMLFLDGAPVQHKMLTVSTGQHELRLVQAGHEPHAIRFEVVDGS